MRHFLFALIALGLLACSPTRDLDGPVDPIGNFQLGLVVARATNDLTKGPLSREATKEEWTNAIDTAFKTRFNRFSGGKSYHLGVIVEGYILAQVGVPLVASPKSALIFRLMVIEGGTQKALTEEPHQITVLETFEPENFVSSGLANTREEQLVDLSEAAAKAAENWLRSQPWFYVDGIVPRAYRKTVNPG